MQLKPNRWAGRRVPARPPGRHIWTARGLFVVATILLVWAATSMVTVAPVEQATQVQRAGTLIPSSSDQSENRRIVEAARRPVPLIQPPEGQPRRPARAGTIEVQRPALSVRPQSIKIPAIGIDQDLIELAVVGTDLQVPDDYSDVGWWRGGPAPGDEGASVMVGHVDSPTGPAVFYELSGLRPGNEIIVGLDNGSRTVWKVRQVEAYERTRFPSARVYRSDGQPTLHLLTCGGTFDSEANHYLSNVVVYADLVERIPAGSDKPAWYERLSRDSEQKLAHARQERRERAEKAVGPRQTERPEQTERAASRPGWYDRVVRDSRRKIDAAAQGEPR